MLAKRVEEFREGNDSNDMGSRSNGSLDVPLFEMDAIPCTTREPWGRIM